MATADPQPILSGRYEMGALLGRGGMADVYSGVDHRLGRPIAIKVLRSELAIDPSVRLRFESEARTAARLSHPNVVGVLDTGEEADVAYIIMERLPGTTLSDELEIGPLPEDRVRVVGIQVLAALAAAHEAGIIHRDIKPANVLTCADGTVKVADFGIAIVMDAAHSVTSTGLLIGTPAYLAPERMDGELATPSADLYSVGALLYQCLTGVRPFEGGSTIELVAAVRLRRPTPIAELRSSVDPELAAVIEQALEKRPDDRPPTAAHFRALLLETSSRANAPTVTMAVGGGAGDHTAVLPQPDGTPPAWQAPPRPTRRTHERPTFQAFERGLAEALTPVRGWLQGPARAFIRSHKALVAFGAAMLLALVIGLSIASSGGGSAPVTGNTPTTQTTQPGGSSSVPGPLERSLQQLQKAVQG